MGAGVLFLDGGLGFVFALLWVFCVVDVIMTPERLCRNLPKLAWVFIVLLFFDIGAFAWLIAGRPWGARTWASGVGSRGVSSRPPVAAPTSPARPTNPDDDEEFLASLRLRAEEQRRRAREATERQRQEPDKDLGL
jgi:Phospholipase_D-nuclease N-terminal